MSNPHDWETEQLEGEYEDMLFKLAMLRLENNNAEKLKAAIEADSCDDIRRAEIDELNAQAAPRVIANMRRELKRQHTRALMKHTLPKIGHAAASILLVFCLGFGTALAAVPAVRVYFFEMVTRSTKEYTEVHMLPSETDYVDVPAEWTGNYFPTNIPEGYEIYELDSSSICSYVSYVNDSNEHITFFEDGVDASINIDTENAQMSYETVHDSQALVAVKGNRVIVIWNEFDKILTIILHGDKDFALEVARSVRKIK